MRTPLRRSNVESYLANLRGDNPLSPPIHIQRWLCEDCLAFEELLAMFWRSHEACLHPSLRRQINEEVLKHTRPLKERTTASVFISGGRLNKVLAKLDPQDKRDLRALLTDLAESLSEENDEPPKPD